MRRISFSFFLFVIMVFAINYFMVEPISDKYFETYMRKDINSYLKDVTKGTVYLISHDLKAYPKSRWGERLDVIKPEFGYDLRLGSLEKEIKKAGKRAWLKSGGFLFRTESEEIIALIEGSDQVLMMGSFPEFEELESFKRFEILDRFFTLLLLVVLSLIWGIPFWKNLKNLMNASEKFGNGDLSVRSRVMRFSSLKPLGESFNAMAGRIQRLMDSQKMLLNAVSHEIRTPISRIRFGIEMAQTPDKDEQRHYLDDIVRDVDDLDALVTELLTYTRFDGERPELISEELPAGEWLHSLVERAARVEHRIGFVVRDKDLPEVAFGDGRYLTRAVENLLSNAARHADATVEVSLKSGGEGFVLMVDDDGAGIPENERRKIFEPFVRLDESRNRRSGGYGLGLAIVRQIIEWHGGDVKVCSSPAGGARFILSWPGKKLLKG